MISRSVGRIGIWITTAILFGLASLPVHTGEPAKRKYRVKIEGQGTAIAEVDSTRRVNFQGQGNFFVNVTTLQGQQLHLSHFPQFRVDGVMLQPGQNGRLEAVNTPLKQAGGKQRNGVKSIWVVNDLHVTQTTELHASLANGAGKPRLMNTVLVTFTIENKGAKAHNVGTRVCMDTYVIDNDACLFAAPTHPGKVLDGIVLENKTLPPYVQMLQKPNLANPGFISHLTLDLGARYEKANKVVLSSLGVGFEAWDMVAAPAMGDSAISFYWPTKAIKPGEKRTLAYAYGEGLAAPADSEGQFQVSLGGSFEPGKTCTIAAVVADPTPGQTMSLELPAGMKLLEGKDVQAVAPLEDDQDYSTVLWKARVEQPGQYSIRIRSSTGVTQTKIITITAEK